MAALYSGGVFCLCISIWGVIQLTFLGFFYSIEASNLIGDVKPHDPHEYKDIGDFLKKSKENYQTISASCYYSAYIYLVMIVVSWIMISVGKRHDLKVASSYSADEICGTLKKPKRI